MVRAGVMRSAGLVLATCAALASCGPPAERAIGVADPAGRPDEAPYLRVLGTVQDGGLPHAACRCVRCDAARSDDRLRRRVASVALCLPASKRVFLVDATPDIREQLHDVARVRESAPGVERAPVDGIFLTHAHIGHYLGLAFFGFEAIHSRGLPVYCTSEMASFLRSNAPWDQLVRLGNVRLEEISPGQPVDLGDGVRVEGLRVPHRDEYADTVGFIVRGPRRTVLYVPDTDSWDAWPAPLSRLVEGVDTAIVDGTFFSRNELPGRRVSSIGHPLMTHTMDLLGDAVAAGKLGVYFTHLNHSNPALSPGDPARAEIERRGFRVLEEGDRLDL